MTFTTPQKKEDIWTLKTQLINVREFFWGALSSCQTLVKHIHSLYDELYTMNLRGNNLMDPLKKITVVLDV